MRQQQCFGRVSYEQHLTFSTLAHNSDDEQSRS